jgi:hypothetical protein
MAAMAAPPARVIYSSLFFALTMLLIAVARPRALFDLGGRPIPMGSGPGRTVFPLGVITVIAAALSLYVFAMIDILY